MKRWGNFRIKKENKNKIGMKYNIRNEELVQPQQIRYSSGKNQ